MPESASIFRSASLSEQGKRSRTGTISSLIETVRRGSNRKNTQDSVKSFGTEFEGIGKIPEPMRSSRAPTNTTIANNPNEIRSRTNTEITYQLGCVHNVLQKLCLGKRDAIILTILIGFILAG